MGRIARWLRGDRSGVDPTVAPLAGPQTMVPGLSPSVRPDQRVRFHDPSVAARLDRDGYARLGQFLDADQVDAANGVFAEARRRLVAPIGERWFPTILLPDDAVREYITERLGAIIGPGLEAVADLRSFDVVRLDYSVKPPSPESGLGPHQDYALVDERSAQSLYLWVPLCDADESNGTLEVVPGSHRFTNRIRSRHVPSVFDEVLPEIHHASERLDCRAGELIVMVSGVIHFSPPNRSDELRLAAHGIVKPAGAPIEFYFQDELTPEDLVECYELDIDAYVQAIHQGREGITTVPTRMAPRPPSSLSPERFARGMSDHAADHLGP